MVAELDVRNHRAAVENDELELRNDDLDIQIAGLEGRSAAKAQAKRRADRMQLVLDENSEHLDQISSAFGPDPRVSSAMERSGAAQLSLSVYSAVLTRDEHLAYATAVLWLAFGFAVALGAQQRILQRAE